MKKFRFLITFALLLLLLVGITLSVGASSSGSCGTNVSWTLDDAGTLTISGTGAMTNYSSDDLVPWYSSRDAVSAVSIKEGVTSIGNYAFYHCVALTDISIPNSIESIGSHAFDHCSSLTSIIIPDGVSELSDRTFNFCASLKTITLPNSIVNIGEGAFYLCSSLVDITIPYNVSSIGENAFYTCQKLTKIIIPSSINIGSAAFSGCSHLNYIFYCGTSSNWDSISIGSNNAPLENAIKISNAGYNGNIYYDGGNDINAPLPQTKKDDQLSIVISSQIPTRTGLSFTNWLSDDGKTYYPGDAYTGNDNLIFTAQWETATYTITYSADEGTGLPVDQKKTYGKSIAISKDIPTRNGYTFLNWLGDDGVQYSAGDIYSSEKNVVLTAQWEIDTYSVNFNANYGSGAPEAQIKTYNVPLTLSDDEPIWYGYVFAGWGLSKNGNVVYQPGDVYEVNEGIELFAIWEPIEPIHNEPLLSVKSCDSVRGGEATVEILYLNNIGTAGMAFDVLFDEDALILESYTIGMIPLTGTPVKYVTNKITFVCGMIENVTGDGTLATLKFRVKDTTKDGSYPICIAVHQGTQYRYDSYDELDFSIYVQNGEVEVLNYIPGDANGDGVVNNRDASRILQYLANWPVVIAEVAADANGDGVVNNRDASRILQYLAGWPVTFAEKEEAIYAPYTVNYYFEIANGDGYVLDATYTESKIAKIGTIVTTAPQTISGFTFDNTNSANALSGEITKDGGLVLTLYYSRNRVKYTFAHNNGTTKTTEKIYKYGAVLTGADIPLAPPYVGYDFDGWYSDNIALGSGYTVGLSPVTVKAKWKQKICSVIFSFDDGKTKDVVYSVPYGTIIVYSDLPEVPVCSGYEFEGWYIGSKALGDVYEVTGTEVITAKWSENPLDLSGDDEVIAEMTRLNADLKSMRIDGRLVLEKEHKAHFLTFYKRLTDIIDMTIADSEHTLITPDYISSHYASEINEMKTAYYGLDSVCTGTYDTVIMSIMPNYKSVLLLYLYDLMPAEAFDILD